MSAKSAPRIMYIKDEYTFHFSNFLIIDLCSFAIAPPEVFLSTSL